MPKRINLPAQRRNTEIAELIAKFERLDIDHAMMQRVIDQVLAAVGRCAGPKIVIVAGPTGVGKTTAARRIYVQKRNDYLPLMQADKDLVPVVGLSAVSPLGNSFAWKDFFQRLLRQAFEPAIDRRLMPPRQEAIYEEDLYLESADRFAADPLRRAVENCLKRRGTRTLVIDEAHHIFMAKDPKRLEFQFEALKSLSIETRLTIVLFGTYALLDIVDQSGQLVRRSQVIHFPRYDGEDRAQVDEFRSFLHRLTMQLQLPRQGSLMADADYYFTKSAGCAGILKDWMAKAYEGALSEGRRSIDKNFADTFAIPNRNLCTIIREAELGEDRLADVPLHTLKAMLMPNIFGRPNGGAANDEAPDSTRKVGQRRARRDPVGLDPTGTS